MGQPMIVEPTPAGSLDAQNECAHDRVSDQDVCLDCGLAFFYCHACSSAGGAERGIYHAKPLCESEGGQ